MEEDGSNSSDSDDDVDVRKSRQPQSVVHIKQVMTVKWEALALRASNGDIREMMRETKVLVLEFIVRFLSLKEDLFQLIMHQLLGHFQTDSFA